MDIGRRVLLVFCMLCMTACGPGGGGGIDLGTPLADTGTDAGPDMGSDAGADAGDMGPDAQNLALCEGEPANWPPRPRWGDITSGYPEYEEVMNNFNILDSLQLFASMISKAVAGLNTLTNAADTDDTGYCICNCTTPTPDWSLLPEVPNQIPNWAMGQQLPGTCYNDTQTKEQCVDQCDTGSFQPFTNVMEVESDEPYLWITSDTFEQPNGDPRYALRLIQFIDQITGFLSAGQMCMTTMDCSNDAVCDMQDMTCKSQLRQVLDTLSMAGANLTMKVQQIISALSQVFEVINRFTEGFHLGGYSTQRPDLHMCVGWAGHGAFSQLENLSSDKLSIGAKYGAHQISHVARAQLRTGGFGVSALGKSLSILPTPEANIQIDGWKVWNADKPFGVQFPTQGIAVADIEKYDIFDLVDDPQVNDLAGVDGIIQPGELVIVDYYPAVYSVNMNSYEWPRSMNDPMNSWIPWSGWEGEAESKAVFSAGLNLPLEIEPIEKTLPTIPIFPPYASITPYFSLGAGVEWIHDAFYLRDRIRDKINEGIPMAAQLTEDDFAREMHDLQAPDLSEDNGTTAYVHPELGAILTFGLQLAKWVSLGINARLGIGAKVEPGGFGGVVDLNYALVQALMNSNPPADAPCTPIYDEQTSDSCSNEAWEESQAEYACDGEGLTSSCCITVGNETACVESWTGIEQDFCEEPANFVAGSTYVDQVNGWLDQLRNYAGQSLVNDLAAEVTDQVVVTTTWNDQISCARSGCSGGLQVPGISSLSECEQFGTCADADGMILAHDVSEADCLGYNQRGPGRCCSDKNADGDYQTIQCGGSQLECENQDDGIWFPGGICTSNVSPKDCTNRDDTRLGNTNLTWTPYDCVTSIEPEVVGWEGDGCHPLNQGFPSACGCASTTDCAAGETCNEDGQCEDAAGATDCICDPNVSGSCVAGRICVDGGCAKECMNDSDCQSSFVCDAGACMPEHDIPTAESIVWNMQNGDEPLHAISTYAWSEILFLAYSSFSLDIGLALRVFGKTFEVTVFELAKIWDLGSTNKAWYQPGLEARYQSECSAPEPQLVTNRQPNPVTVAQGVSIDAVDGFDGYVARYPENNNGNLDPNMDGNACHPNAPQCTWEDLVTWCQDEIPQNVINPAEPQFSDLTDGLTDTVDWGEDIGLELWDAGQICIDGEPWYEWSQNANGSLDNLDCIYDGPNGQVTFPCGKAPLELLEAFGCLDTNLNTFASQLASQHGTAITTNGGAQFNAQAMMADPNGEFASYNILPQYLFSGFLPTGLLWMNTVQACFETTLEAESFCECTMDSDCGDGQTCNVDGFCENSGGQLTECPVVGLANPPQPEPCCGDGVQQDFEECDDGNTVGGDGCTSYCNLDGDPTAEGACCYKSAVGNQCIDPVTLADCQKYEQGTFFAGQTCSQVECPGG